MKKGPISHLIILHLNQLVDVWNPLYAVAEDEYCKNMVRSRTNLVLDIQVDTRHSSKEQFHRQCIAVNICYIIIQSFYRSKVFHCQTVRGHQLWIQGIYNEFCLFTEKNLRFWKFCRWKNRYIQRILGRSNRIRYSLQPKFKNNFT